MIRLFVIPEFDHVAMQLGHESAVTSMAFSPSSKILVTTSKSPSIIMWGVPSMEPIRNMSVKGATTHTSLSLSDARLVTGSEDSVVRVWDAETGKIVRELDKHTGPVTSLTLSPSKTHFASGGADKKVHYYSTSDLEYVASVKCGFKVNSIAYIDNQSIAIGCEGSPMTHYDITTGTASSLHVKHTHTTAMVVFRPKGIVKRAAGLLQWAGTAVVLLLFALYSFINLIIVKALQWLYKTIKFRLSKSSSCHSLMHSNADRAEHDAHVHA